MANCPKCQLPNPDGAESCVWCGESVAAAAAAEPAAAPAAAAPDAAPFGPAYASPMIVSPRPTTYVEPILTPATTPPEQKPLPSHVGLLFAPAPSAPGASAAGPPASVVTTPTGPLASVAARTPTPAAPPMQVKLVALRGQRVGMEYPVYEGRNVIGRFADKPVDIDLMIQEAEGQIWSSRQHAVVLLSQGAVLVEDLNSLNGTWVNGSRLHAGQQKPLKPNDVIQIGAVQLKVVVTGG